MSIFLWKTVKTEKFIVYDGHRSNGAILGYIEMQMRTDTQGNEKILRRLTEPEAASRRHVRHAAPSHTPCGR